MRENVGIYRGKRIDTGAWREGYLLGVQKKVDGKDLFFIVDKNNEYHRVDPETVGEYTGLTDSTGTGIFEGDILCSFATNKKFISIVKIGAFKPDFFYTGIFEGDILCSFAANKKFISIVKIGAFKPDFFYDFAHEHGYDMSVKVYGLYAYIASDREDIMLAADMKLASVIGNIHDNPELLMKRNEDNLGDD